MNIETHQNFAGFYKTKSVTEMDFDEEDDDIILLLLVVSNITNLLSILSQSRRQLVWVKLWLQHRSTKSVYDYIT